MTDPIDTEIPGDRGWPLIGYSVASMRDPIALTERRRRRYGDISWLSVFGTRIVTLVGAEANAFVLLNTDNQFDNSAWRYFLSEFFRRGLMLLDFEEHRYHRRLLQAAFRSDAMASYLVRMQPLIQSSMDAWPEGDGFLAYDRFKQLTLDLGVHVFINEPSGPAVDALNRAFFATVQAPTSLLRRGVPGGRWRRGQKGRRELERFFHARIADKRSDGGDDLFARLCRAEGDQGELLSDDDIVNHMIFVLMAAHDTSTIALTNTVYHLAREPRWQDRLRAESRALGREMTGRDALARLETMDRVIQEALRLTPPVPSLPRRVTRDTQFKGFTLRKGQMVQIVPSHTHRMAEYWHNPEQFDPDRFAEPRSEHKGRPFQYLPFGGGAHKCIGMHFGQMEIKAVLHRLLLDFEWQVPDGYIMQQDYTSLPVPKDRLPIRLKRL